MPESSVPQDALAVTWREGLVIINLRGRPDDAAFRQAAEGALGIALPVESGLTVEGAGLRIVWAGPDDWFLIGAAGEADVLTRRLREALVGKHAAVTDVSSGYTVLRLAGAAVGEVLAQGCPLDLHPRAFGPGHTAGTHFFKATVWLWRTDGESAFELLVRRSFSGYMGLMLERSTRECGLNTTAA